MRRLLAIFFGLMALISNAFAADYGLPILRGSQSFLPSTPKRFHWEGFYAGGHVTYSDSAADFSNSLPPLVALVRPVLGIGDTGATGFGGFVGYNTQWDEVVVGAELNYTRSSLNSISSVTLFSPNVPASDGFSYDVTNTGTGSLNIQDFAVLRGRLGWATSNFMPYATFGLAAGRADITLSTTTTFQNTINPVPVPAPGCTLAPCIVTQTQSKESAFIYGYALGAGLDVGLTRNIFLRGEYEYIQWSHIWAISPHLNIARLGLGLKF